MFKQSCARAARRSLVLSLIVLVALPALSAVQRAGTAHAATAQVSEAFFNNSSYPIVELIVDGRLVVAGQDIAPGLVAAEILPHTAVTLQVAAGQHTYSAESELDSGSTLRPYHGSFTALAGSGGVLGPVHCARLGAMRGVSVIGVSRNCVQFNDPSMAQLLTHGGSKGVWTTQFQSADPNTQGCTAAAHCHCLVGCAFLMSFTFFASGSAVVSLQDVTSSASPPQPNWSETYSYTQLSREPAGATVTFSVGPDYTGVYAETQDVFHMDLSALGGGSNAEFTFKHS